MANSIKKTEIQSRVSNFFLDNPQLILNFAVGTGKTLAALLCSKKILEKHPDIEVKLLVHQTVHKQAWAEELEKHGIDLDYKVECYASASKLVTNKPSFYILDEGHRVTPRVLNQMKKDNIQYLLVLSATIGDEKINLLSEVFKNLAIVSISLEDSINLGLTYKPKVFEYVKDFPEGTLPKGILQYNDFDLTWREAYKALSSGIRHSSQEQRRYQIVASSLKKKLKKSLPEHLYSNAFGKEERYKKSLFTPVQQQEVDKVKRLLSKVSYISKTLLEFSRDRNLLYEAAIRPHLYEVSKAYIESSNNRIITFCPNIEICESMPHELKYHSKADSSVRNTAIEDFNSGKVNSLACVDALNEGVNIYNVHVGVMGNYSWPKTRTVMRNGEKITENIPTTTEQRFGRLVRSENAKVVFCYIEDTHEYKKFLEFKKKNQFLWKK